MYQHGISDAKMDDIIFQSYYSLVNSYYLGLASLQVYIKWQEKCKKIKQPA